MCEEWVPVDSKVFNYGLSHSLTVFSVAQTECLSDSERRLRVQR